MKDVAGGRLLPEANFSTLSSTCEEAAIRGEGHRQPVVPDIHRIQEEFRMLSIPHKDSPFEDKCESRVGGEEEKSI